MVDVLDALVSGAYAVLRQGTPVKRHCVLSKVPSPRSFSYIIRMPDGFCDHLAYFLFLFLLWRQRTAVFCPRPSEL